MVPSALRLKTLTRGPPPWSGETTNSALPSPSKSPAATYPPPVKSPPNGSNGATRTVVLSFPLMTATRIGVPGPVTAMMSAVPSPFTSPATTRMFVVSAPNGATVAPGAAGYVPAAFGRKTAADPFVCPETISGNGSCGDTKKF